MTVLLLAALTCARSSKRAHPHCLSHWKRSESRNISPYYAPVFMCEIIIMKKIKDPSFGYELLRQRIKKNKSLKNLTNDDIDIIIFNQLRMIAKNRGWIKDIPSSVFHHK
jgi:hypothetical protein